MSFTYKKIAEISGESNTFLDQTHHFFVVLQGYRVAAPVDECRIWGRLIGAEVLLKVGIISPGWRKISPTRYKYIYIMIYIYIHNIYIYNIYSDIDIYIYNDYRYNQILIYIYNFI